MKYILFNAITHVLEARYDSEINDTIPEAAIEVDDDTFFATINEQDGVWMLIDDVIVKEPFPAPTLDDLKATKYNEIRPLYEAEANAPVSALGETWHGGYDSALKLDGARRLAEAAGADTVTFYDVDNYGHEYYLPEALDVAIAVSVAYQTALAKKQSLFVAIAEAEDANELNSIEWEPSVDAE